MMASGFRTSQPGSGGAATVTGAQTPADSYANPTDALDSFALGAVWNGTGWDRARSASVFQAATTQVGLPAVAPIGIFNTALPSLTNGQQSQLQMNAAGGIILGGSTTAHDAPDANNPLKVGGYASTTPPTAVAAADRVNAWFGLNGQQASMLADSSGNVINSSAPSADGANLGGQRTLIVTDAAFAFNESTWDRRRGNTNNTALASAARTTATQSSDLTNYNGKGLHLVIDITAFTAGSITVTIQGKDALSGKYYTILASAALAAVATTVLRVHPGLTAAGNLVANDVIPRTWRVDVAVGSADSITYSIGYSLVT